MRIAGSEEADAKLKANAERLEAAHVELVAADARLKDSCRALQVETQAYLKRLQ